MGALTAGELTSESVLLPNIKGIAFDDEPRKGNCRCFQFTCFILLYAQVRKQILGAQQSLYEASLRVETFLRVTLYVKF